MRLQRSRLVEALIAIVCVALAAGGVRLSQERPPYDYRRAGIGEAVAVEGGEVTVDRVRVGTRLARDGAVLSTTAGMFVVVTVTGAAPGVQGLFLGDARLLAQGGREYAAYELNGGLDVDPGFEQQADLVFEVDPTRIEDLTLEMWRLRIISGFESRLQVHLGITAANADDWRAAAVGQVLEPRGQSVTRAGR